MTELTRRGVLAGLMLGAASPVLGEAVTRSLRPRGRTTTGVVADRKSVV